jgi:hypothetical protein
MDDLQALLDLLPHYEQELTKWLATMNDVWDNRTHIINLLQQKRSQMNEGRFSEDEWQEFDRRFRNVIFPRREDFFYPYVGKLADVYQLASAEDQAVMRKAVAQYKYVRESLYRYLVDIGPKLQLTRDVLWLMRGLAAAAIVNTFYPPVIYIQSLYISAFCAGIQADEYLQTASAWFSEDIPKNHTLSVRDYVKGFTNSEEFVKFVIPTMEALESGC